MKPPLEQVSTLTEAKASIKKERVEKRGQHSFNLPPKCISGRMGIKLATLTRVSPVSSRSQVTKKKQRERIPWVAVRPTRNDIQG
jgi:hypothetical protein